jgi:hypothetical protein
MPHFSSFGVLPYYNTVHATYIYLDLMEPPRRIDSCIENEPT